MNLFSERLEAFPRITPYRQAKAAQLWPYYKTVETAATPRFTIEGREVINFGSNNYLSLSYHPDVIAAAQAATAHYGTGVTGSRLLNGTLPLHRQLEEELADFYGREAALVFPTGYVANLCGISGLPRPPRLRDRRQGGPQLAGHRRSAALRRAAEAVPPQRRRPPRARSSAELPPGPAKGVIVDGVYSMRGDTAPLPEIVDLVAQTPEHVPLRRRSPRPRRARRRRAGARPSTTACSTGADIITVTFSKTLGSCGGARDRQQRRHRAAHDRRPRRSSSPRRTCRRRWPPRCAALRILRERPRSAAAAPRQHGAPDRRRSPNAACARTRPRARSSRSR